MKRSIPKVGARDFIIQRMASFHLYGYSRGISHNYELYGDGDEYGNADGNGTACGFGDSYGGGGQADGWGDCLGDGFGDAMPRYDNGGDGDVYCK